MLFGRDLWDGLADGRITVAFRRWRRPSVKAGGTLQTPAGRLAIDEVRAIEPDDITPADAVAAGFADPGAVLASLRPEGTLHRVRFHRLGDDPRVALRADDRLDDAARAGLEAALARLGWARPVLALIAERPGVVSTELAAELGLERLAFKQRARRLKELGLTESLPVGYRLSPRGRAFLALDGLALDGRELDGGSPPRAAP